MDQDTARALAEIRAQLAQLRSALKVLTPGQAEAAVISLRLAVQSMSGNNASITGLLGNVTGLQASVQTISSGTGWQPLAMPPGASGTALYRPQAGGLLALRIALSWRSAPGSTALYGVPASLWPALPWSDGAVSVALNGTVTLNVTGARFSASVLVPLK
jgi:hypothetical protein